MTDGALDERLNELAISVGRILDEMKGMDRLAAGLGALAKDQMGLRARVVEVERQMDVVWGGPGAAEKILDEVDWEEYGGGEGNS